MDSKKLDNKMLTFGNTTINTEGLKGMTEKQFMDTYEKLISTGAKQALKTCKKYLKK